MDTALMSTTDAERSGSYIHRGLLVMKAVRRTPVLRHGWLRRLAGAASVPGGIPPGRSRPSPWVEDS